METAGQLNSLTSHLPDAEPSADHVPMTDLLCLSVQRVLPADANFALPIVDKPCIQPESPLPLFLSFLLCPFSFLECTATPLPGAMDDLLRADKVRNARKKVRPLAFLGSCCVG